MADAARLKAAYLADTSALHRLSHPQVAERLGPLLEEGAVATCAVVDLEVLYSAKSADDYDAVRTERRAFPDIPITPQVMARALEVQAQLAQRGQHRLPIPDLIIGAAAESAELVLLHYDADHERIADVTGQTHEWVVPRGAL